MGGTSTDVALIRDGDAVWTGSTNWTDDSWTRCENVIVLVGSEAVAAAYTKDFEQLWTSRAVERSGFVEPVPLSPAVKTGNLVFVSGMPAYYGDRQIAKGDFPAQMHQVMKSIQRSSDVL